MILEKILPGAVLLTYDWKAYRAIGTGSYLHVPVTSPGGQQTRSQWPLVHQAASNFIRWLLGTHRHFGLPVEKHQ